MADRWSPPSQPIPPGADRTATDDELDRWAGSLVGVRRLRPGQRRAVRARLAGRDVLAVMPTGAGKSAIYQLVAAGRPGLAVVVSPLVALQRDQLQFIAAHPLGDAEALNAQLTDGQRSDVLERLSAGELRFVFLAPEQLANPETFTAVSAAAIGCLVVDEAHCVSEWGHDFRPDYLRLGAVVEALGHPPVVALTATAAPAVRSEIVERLGLHDPEVVVAGFDRPNLHLAVSRFDDGAERDGELVRRVTALAGSDGTGIVYAATRARTERLAERLRAQGVEAAAYHAGLGKGRRAEVHDAFLGGTATVVVATTAFGMGIDKPDVRFVLHADVPESVDALYQEIGRAGRDGRPARTELLYRPADLGLRRFQTGGAGDPVAVERVAHAVALTIADGARDAPVTIDELQERAALSRRRAVRALDGLEEAGALRIDAAGEVTTTGDVKVLEDAVARVGAREQDRRARDASRVEMIRAYAETRSCRRRFLLTYLGEAHPGGCGRCDNCEEGRSGSDEQAAATDDRWPSQQRVAHRQWGPGRVIAREGDVMTVAFDSGAYRTLSVRLVEEAGLLVPLDAGADPEAVRAGS